jgi:hypothetical protein
MESRQMNTGNGSAPSETTLKPGGGPAAGAAPPFDDTAKTRKRKPTTEEVSHGRFFLAKKEASGGSPALGQEFTQEGEAMVEAFRTGGTYYRIEEFKPVADFASGMPALKKEPVLKK